jgi:hypothetical protein
MINITKVAKKLNLTIKDSDILIFKNLQAGNISSDPISYIFDDYPDSVVFKEIYSTEKIITETFEYNEKLIDSDIPLIPTHCFILGEDIGNDPIIYNSITGQLLFACELTWYEPVEILNTIERLPELLKAVSDFDYFAVINKIELSKFNLSDIDSLLASLNIIKTDELVHFLLSLNVGTMGERKYFKYFQNGTELQTFISLIYSKSLIIEKTKKYRNNTLNSPFIISGTRKFLVFGEEIGGFSIGLDLKTYSIFIIEYEPTLAFKDINSFLNFVN